MGDASLHKLGAAGWSFMKSGIEVFTKHCTIILVFIKITSQKYVSIKAI
jgi:hypothetical protein